MTFSAIAFDDNQKTVAQKLSQMFPKSVLGTIPQVAAFMMLARRILDSRFTAGFKLGLIVSPRKSTLAFWPARAQLHTSQRSRPRELLQSPGRWLRYAL